MGGGETGVPEERSGAMGFGDTKKSVNPSGKKITLGGGSIKGPVSQEFSGGFKTATHSVGGGRKTRRPGR